jgi:hypothetical protein
MISHLLKLNFDLIINQFCKSDHFDHFDQFNLYIWSEKMNTLYITYRNRLRKQMYKFMMDIHTQRIMFYKYGDVVYRCTALRKHG